MNSERAVFFDSQVDTSWADAPYGHEEAPKLERLAHQCGSLDGRSVLEPGCGTGRLTQWLARAVGPGGFVHACDISRLMVRKALVRTRGLIQVKVSHAAMENLNFVNGCMDLVVCHQVFPHFSDKPRALTYMANLLKPGGTLLIVHFECRRIINDVHRKAGTVVEKDLLPDRGQIEGMLDAVGLGIRYYSDDSRLGYLLNSIKKIPN
jgi:demethylmenaquinone methyltransferase/2-methoxy-6-polyprenyl-1,4-benzoquinol methylase